jgi:alpha-tubulin suppressor-like RCC1 family protein
MNSLINFNNGQPFALVYPPNYNNNNECKNVLLIDNDVEDAQIFASSANAATFPIIYSNTSKKSELLELLRSTFTTSKTIERIGLVFTTSSSNKEKSKIFLDNKPFFINHESSSSSPYSENVDFLISLLKEFSVKNIDYLACNTLNYPNWVNYYTLLNKETDVVVGASNDETGNINYGGDWIMENTSENIELIYFTKGIEYYTYLLDAPGNHFIAFKTDGTIWVTGHNNDGQLGLGDTTQRLTLTPMITTMIQEKTPKYISCGFSHTIVLMTDGTIWGTGYNGHGQLGIPVGDTSQRLTLTQMDTTTMTIGNRKPKYISCGQLHTIVLMTDGTIWGTGDNDDGQLGLGNITDCEILTRMDTTMIQGRTPQYISCGEDHTIVLMTDGTIWGTGRNLSGQLGLNDTTSRLTLTQMDSTIMTIGNKTPQYISCGFRFTIVLMTDGTIWGTGINSSGQLGLGNTTDCEILTQMDTTMIEGRTPQYISCGESHTIVLMTDGTIWGTGRNGNGQLGLDNTTDCLTLTQMDTTTTIGNRTPQYISCNITSSYTLMTDGTIWGTGYNSRGQLGLGDTTSRRILTQMGDNNNNIAFIMGMMNYQNDINANICFQKGTRILTPEGYKPVEELEMGDLITSTKNIKSSIPIKAIVKFIGNKEDGALYCLPKDSLKKGKPLNDLYMSADHAYKHNGVWKHMKCASATEFPNSRTKKYTYLTDVDNIEYYHLVIEDYFAHTIVAEGVEVETCFKSSDNDGVIMLWTCDEKSCVPLKCEKAISKRKQKQVDVNNIKPFISLIKGISNFEKKKKSMTIWAYNKELDKNMPLNCNEITLPQ